MRYRLYAIALLSSGLVNISQAGAPDNAGLSMRARIQGLTCTLSLDFGEGRKNIVWNVGLTGGQNGSTQIPGGGLLGRLVTLSFQNPGFIQTNPTTGLPVDCSTAQGGVSIRFTAKDNVTLAGQSGKDLKMGLIPLVRKSTTEKLRYFEYYVTYDPIAMQAAAGESMTLTAPNNTGEYKNQQIMPLFGNLTDTQLTLKFKPNATTDHQLGKYPFYIWLVDTYTDKNTAPQLNGAGREYRSSVTITATYL